MIVERVSVYSSIKHLQLPRQKKPRLPHQRSYCYLGALVNHYLVSIQLFANFGRPLRLISILGGFVPIDLFHVQFSIFRFAPAQVFTSPHTLFFTESNFLVWVGMATPYQNF
jgi:hypothetical protein